MEKIKYIEKKTNKRREYRYCDSILSSNKKIKTIKEIEKLVDMIDVRHTKMEVLYNDEEIKPYFDYDYKQNRRYTAEELEEHLQKCKYALNVFFGQIVNDWDITRDVAIASRHGKVPSGEYKISYRFYVINGMYTNLQTMDMIVKTMNELNIFDSSVYNHNRKIAMLYGHKSKDDRRVLLPIEKMKWRHVDFIIQYVPRWYKYELSCEMEEMNVVTRERKVYCSELMNIKAMEMPTNIRYDIEMDDIRGLLSIIPNDKIGIIDTNTWITIGYALCEAKKKGQTTLSDTELKKIFLEFSRRYPGSDVNRDSEVFDSCMNNTKYDIGIDYLYGLIRRIYPKYWKEYNERKIRKPKEMEYDEEYCEEEMRDYRLAENDLVLVKANPGVGKTVQLKKQIEALSVDTRICFISYNKVLCYKDYQEFPNFKLYCEETDCDADRIVICLDSLYKIEDCEFDLVILDEAFSVQSHFESAVMKNPQLVMNKFQSILIRSKKVIMLDANGDEKIVTDVVKWIETIKKIKAYRIHNKFVRPTNRRAIFMGRRTMNKQISFVMEKLKEGKRVVVPVSSKVVAEKLEMVARERMPGIKMKKYDSESCRSELYKDVTNPNEAWSDLDLLIYTPTIGAGVSFERKHFDICVGIFESSMNHAPVYICYQQLFRARMLKEGEMYLFINKTEYEHLAVDERKVEYMMKKEIKKIEKYSLNMDMRELNIETGKIEYDKRKLSYSTIKNLILTKNRSLMYFEEIMEKLMTDNNIPIVNMEHEEIKEIKGIKDMTENKTDENVKREFVERFKNEDSLVLSVEEMRKIERELKNGGMDVTKEDSIRRNITRNLEKWGSEIGKITESFYKENILSVTNGQQRGIDERIIRSRRYKNMNDELRYTYERINEQYREYESEEDHNFKIYRNSKKTGHQKVICTKRMLMGVFGVKDGKIREIFEGRYKNKEWKDRLQRYIEGMSAEEWKYTLGLFGLDVVKKRKGREDTNYRERSKFKTKNSSLGANLIKTMVGDTFGIQFEPYDTHKMIFLETEWNKVKEENRTYLNMEYKMLEEEE